MTVDDFYHVEPMTIYHVESTTIYHADLLELQV